MTQRSVPVLVTAAMLVWRAVVLNGSMPTFWHVARQADFLKGEVEHLSIDSDGRLVLGPRTELVHETAAPFLWALIATADGSIWAGSGNEGKVFRIAPDGKASTVFDAGELEAHALAPAPGGGVFVATSPEGRIYKLTPDGSSSVFFDPDDKYIWALAVDGDGALYAATGDKGVIYRIGRDGKGVPFYKTKATHALSLAFDREGNLLVGTESPGQVLRLDRQGKPFVLLDSAYREIRALRVDDNGVIYAAAISGKRAAGEDQPVERPSTEPARPAPIPTVSTEITAVAIGDVSPSAGSSTPARRDERRSPSKGAVFRITSEGVYDTMWESSDDSPYDIALEPGGSLLVGTGGKGKLYRVAGDPARTTLLGRAEAQQITMFFRDAKARTYFATANPGKIFRLTSGRAERGTYESEVKDAGTVAGWGTIRWRSSVPADGQVQLFTRSGNTATPDETWSPWSSAYVKREGEQIASPKARYLQWRAVLSGKTDSPVLTSVTAAYLPRNLRPSVTGITVHPPGTVFQKPFSTGELEIAGYDDGGESRFPSSPPVAGAPVSSPNPPLGRRVYQKGFQTFVWKADDDNDDRLQYDVLYRREGETAWKALKRTLSDAILVWDTTSVPDGTYFIKVVASDAPTNSPGTALTGELESTTFDIDNTPPRIDVGGTRRESGRTIMTFRVRDEQAPVQRVEYSLDANRWRVIYPKDGISDSRVEEFDLMLEGDTVPRSVIIRATDAMNNSATAVGESK